MSSDFSERGRCPRDGEMLVVSSGALGEDVCIRCQGRLLNAEATVHLVCEVLGIKRGILRELAREGARRVVCPACGGRMTSTWARSVHVEICNGCGSCFLDGGELERLAKGAIEEVHVSSPAPGKLHVESEWHHDVGAPRDVDGTEVKRSASTVRGLPAHQLRFGLKCVNCDALLDLTRNIWMVNTRPWCDDCAWPHTSVWASMLSLMVAILRRVASPRRGIGLAWWTSSESNRPALWERAPDVMRVSPAEFDRFFGSFYVVMRYDD